MNTYEYLLSLEPVTTSTTARDTEIDELNATITRLGLALADALADQ